MNQDIANTINHQNSENVNTYRVIPIAVLLLAIGILLPNLVIITTDIFIIKLPFFFALNQLFSRQFEMGHMLSMISLLTTIPFALLLIAYVIAESFNADYRNPSLIGGFFAVVPFMAFIHTVTYFPGHEDGQSGLNYFFAPILAVVPLVFGVIIGAFLYRITKKIVKFESGRHIFWIFPVVLIISVICSLLFISMNADADRALKSAVRMQEQLANEAKLKGDKKTSKLLYAKVCESGIDNACGWLAFYGEETNDLAEKKKLFDISCKMNNSRGCNNLGLYYSEFKKDDKKAKEPFRKACEKKDYASCSNLGIILYLEGKNEEAEKLSKLACDNKNGFGCNTLGSLYADRIKDPIKAKKYFELACKYKEPRGCKNLKTIE